MIETVEPKKRKVSDKQWFARINRNGYEATVAIKDAIEKGEQISFPVIEALLKYNGLAILYIPNPTEAMQIAAVNSNPEALKFIVNPSEEVQKQAVCADPASLRFIVNPSSEIIQTALYINPNMIRYVENPSCEIQTIVCRLAVGAIEGIKNPCEAACIAAIEAGGTYAWQDIANTRRENPVEITNNIFAAYLRIDPISAIILCDDLSPELQMVAFKANPRTYLQMKDFPSLDPRLSVLFAKWERTENRGNNLPLAGKGENTAGLNQDQLKLLRWFESNNRSSISVRELKSMPWGNTPYFMDLVKKKNGKDITKADLKSHDARTISQATTDLISKCSISVSNWTKTQIMFKNKDNKSAVYSVAGSVLLDMNLSEEEKNKIVAVVGSGHPSPNLPRKKRLSPFNLQDRMSKEIQPDKQYTLGWIRFTVFGKDIWIDEVQSDWFKLLNSETMSELKDLQDGLLLDFIRRMRRRGYQKLFMPTYEMKKDKDLYDSDPPLSVYRDLPRKMRFKIGKVDGIDPIVDGKEAWILESVIAHTGFMSAT